MLVTSYVLKSVGAAVAMVASFAAMAQSRAPAQKPPDTVKLTVTCYWQNMEIYRMQLLDQVSRSQGLSASLTPEDWGGCSKYKDPTHCERTKLQIYEDAERAKPGRGDWQRVTANGQIFTLRCAKPCTKLPMMGESYEAETDGKWMWVRFEKPDKKDLSQAFEVVDISPMKEDKTANVQLSAPDESKTRLQSADTPRENAPGQSDSAKTPAQILDENRGAVAVIVAAGDTSTKLGTGFFLRSSGLLLTNLHVIEDTELVGVKLPTRSDILWAKNARGFDSENDLAILEVEASGVGTVALGDSDDVRVGEPIVVVSNPEGLEQTVSNGLISGIRDLDGRKLFQISAPISEGSSGGPVFNGRGEVIGIVVSSLQSGQNLNFAVPINYAKPLLQAPNKVPIAALPKRKIVFEDDSKSKMTADQPHQVPDDLPRFWKYTLSGLETEIRVDEVYLYENAESYRVVTAFGEFSNEAHCETKRSGSEWSGKCRYVISWIGSYFSPRTCSVETSEVITSVTDTRIEGKSQPIDYSPRGQIPELCPRPGVGWHEFALAPK